jgi:anthraniloyl-CoA monooxygenase
MKIAVIVGGLGGLYFSILTKKAMPDCKIDIYERNKPDNSFGFGVVFSDETLGEFLSRDLKSYELIRSNFAYWDDIIIARDGQTLSIAGNGFCGCSRKTLLELLQQRCTVTSAAVCTTYEMMKKLGIEAKSAIGGELLNEKY